MSLESGRMVAGYRLVEKIGEGGMGVAWKALDTKLKSVGIMGGWRRRVKN